jgi:SSS family solute:Na+ symporter
LASVLLDGKQKEYSPYTVVGQKRKFAESGEPQKDNGWYLVPGKVDNASYYLLGFMAFTFVFLYLFNAMI